MEQALLFCPSTAFLLCFPLVIFFFHCLGNWSHSGWELCLCQNARMQVHYLLKLHNKNMKKVQVHSLLRLYNENTKTMLKQALLIKQNKMITTLLSNTEEVDDQRESSSCYRVGPAENICL